MECVDIRGRLHAYLDQELELPSVVAIDQHLASCQACKAIFAQQAALRSGIRRHAEYHAAPAALVERIRAQLGAAGDGAAGPARTPAPRRPWLPFRQWFQVGAAVAATAVVSWIAAIQYYIPAADEIVAEQVITGHARAVLGSRLVDVATSDQHTVKPWLSSKLDFSPPVADLTGAGFPLLGGRLDYLDDRPVAALVYRHRQHMIDLFVWPEQKADGDLPMRSLSKHGYNVLHWREAGMVFWAISDLNAADMKAFAEAYARAN
jgi:anti-sigma factor RsiW